MVATNIDAKIVALDIVYMVAISIYVKIVALDIARMVVQKNTV